MFSLDSVLTAVGLVDEIPIMIAAVVIAVGVMLVASGPLSRFVHEHPSVKILALSFLLLIGVTLVADGFGLHIDKAYIYAAMGFSVFVEALNLRRRRRKHHVVELQPDVRQGRRARRRAPRRDGDALDQRLAHARRDPQRGVRRRVRTEVAVVVGAAGGDEASSRGDDRHRVDRRLVERPVVDLEPIEAHVDEVAEDVGSVRAPRGSGRAPAARRRPDGGDRRLRAETLARARSPARRVR